MDKIALAESSDGFKAIKKEWEESAKAAALDTLPAFLTELTENYEHDYGTICHAMAIAAIAAANAVNHSPQGGITGFQAGCVMWEFIRGWNHSHNKTGLCLVDYDNFLYPQYAQDHQKTLSKEVWASIQQEARAKILKADKEFERYLMECEQYKKDIAAFVLKYPDYYTRREHYDPLGMGTGEQWEAEEKKKASGFEFAPQEPYEPITDASPVYRHWQSIVKGIVPFGYTVKGD